MGELLLYLPTEALQKPLPFLTSSQDHKFDGQSPTDVITWDRPGIHSLSELDSSFNLATRSGPHAFKAGATSATQHCFSILPTSDTTYARWCTKDENKNEKWRLNKKHINVQCSDEFGLIRQCGIAQMIPVQISLSLSLDAQASDWDYNPGQKPHPGGCIYELLYTLQGLQ